MGTDLMENILINYYYYMILANNHLSQKLSITLEWVAWHAVGNSAVTLFHPRCNGVIFPKAGPASK
jgi:hypothetical protein